MPVYVLTRPIGAVSLGPPFVATSLPAHSSLTVIGPSKEVDGCIEVKCKNTRYAVFQRDLDAWGEASKSVGQ